MAAAGLDAEDLLEECNRLEDRVHELERELASVTTERDDQQSRANDLESALSKMEDARDAATSELDALHELVASATRYADALERKLRGGA